ncbi:hypothetical protein [Mesorhizobium sp. WSM4887]|uniref:hypothetical protein n=1 Tax=Mesorhizobium sp. WSM4887 TaxID=3038543 RepID=UPI0024172200|nr:hypothetical protein [Mesorhizobium sp. WSM4887]MDG4890919.1 hypothetical protein [Mesorhizobium sp. WSM4887]
MADLPQNWTQDFPIGFDPVDGSPLVPTNPEMAKARLAEREAQPDYLDSLQNFHHPLHKLRMQERRGLLQIAAGATGALPATPKV